MTRSLRAAPSAALPGTETGCQVMFRLPTSLTVLMIRSFICHSSISRPSELISRIVADVKRWTSWTGRITFRLRPTAPSFIATLETPYR